MSEVRDQVDALRAEAAAWEARGLAERTQILRRWADELRARRTVVRDALARDTGRVALSDMEIDAVLGSIERHSGWSADVLGAEQARESSDPDVRITEASVPMGVVGVISPWNFPLQLALIDAVPALLMGCPTLIKPTELCPQFVGPLRESIAAVPELAAVLRLVEGGPEVGSEIVRSVDVVCFTGSVATGRKVAAAAAEAFVPAFLELGGKDAAIVAEGADLEVAAAALLWGGTANTGQSCMSIERIYAEQAVADDLVGRLVARAEKVGLVGVDAGGQVGPFIDPRQADVVKAQLDDAVAKGATIQTGGTIEVHDGRSYLRPTVVTGVDHTMALMTEETFGPVLPVMAVGDLDEAVRLANATRYGLSGAVFGPEQVALDVARRIDAGGISINDVLLTGIVPEGEKQAFKDSGMGPSRMGPAALRRFRRQRVLLSRQTPALQPYWYA
ncbi:MULTISPECIES: aldehyde dehydrogenase family protein [Mumia]|uniref:aldehyde dehydrogenase family protein n=1 Tax=Mumia TaxID=1546255 RepID=UPI0014229113|nr:aldehyde dehydrogenase family protein [Mumia sp. ZJ1417]QMW66253.1 aldehyde dehydrogenase family protein [Mumia sp. ZJ1417]